jgi:hypothetical protein
MLAYHTFSWEKYSNAETASIPGNTTAKANITQVAPDVTD